MFERYLPAPWGWILSLGLLLPGFCHATPGIDLEALASDGIAIPYVREPHATNVLDLWGKVLEACPRVELELRSEVPTQLKLVRVEPGGGSRSIWLVFSPDRLQRKVEWKFSEGDLEPKANWEKIPKGGAIRIVDRTFLGRRSLRNRIHIQSFACSPGPALAKDPTPVPGGFAFQSQEEEDFAKRVQALWRGKVFGGALGMASEGEAADLEALEAWELGSPQDLSALTQEGFGPDDDSSLGFLTFQLFERFGRAPSPLEILVAWASEVSPEIHWKNGFQSLMRFLRGQLPPKTAVGPLGETLSARIRIEPWAIFASSEAEALRLARADAEITSHGPGLADAQFTTAALYHALRGDAPEAAFAKARAAIQGRYAEAWDRGVSLGRSSLPWRDILDRLEVEFLRPASFTLKEDAWVHSLPNAALMGLAYARGRGDLVSTVTLASLLGWDSDCNAATLGAIFAAGSPETPIPSSFETGVGKVLRLASSREDRVDLRTLGIRAAQVRRRLGIEKSPSAVPSQTTGKNSSQRRSKAKPKVRTPKSAAKNEKP